MKIKTKIAAVLSWFFPIGLLWYFLDGSLRKDEFVSYHIRQSSTLFSFLLLIIIFAALLLIFRAFIIIIGGLIVLLLFLLGLYYAFSGKKKPLPLIGFIGEKLDI